MNKTQMQVKSFFLILFLEIFILQNAISSELRNNDIPQYEGWELVWNDEFDVDGVPNPEIWDYEVGFSRNEELQWYQANNAVCEDGFLKIEGRREQVLNPNYVAGSSDWKKNREYAEYTSASITTGQSKSWLYGRFEVRAKIPTELGSWPAIWLLGIEKEWPASGEIDMMEYYLIGGVPHILANAA